MTKKICPDHFRNLPLYPGQRKLKNRRNKTVRCDVMEKGSTRHQTSLWKLTIKQAIFACLLK